MADDRLKDRIERLKALGSFTSATSKQALPAHQTDNASGDSLSARERLERILGGADATRLLTDGRLKKAAQAEAEQTIVEVHVLADKTGSMRYTISEVRDAIDYIADQLFRQGANTKIAVWGIEDHYDSHRKIQLGVFPSPLTNDRVVLREQIDGLKTTFTGGWDFAECYECGWLELARHISQYSSSEKKGERTGVPQKGEKKPTVKRAIITFMETAAHGQLQDLGYLKEPQQLPNSRLGWIFANAYDYGCPYNVQWRHALASAKAFADQWYIIDCDADQGHKECFKTAKRACVTEGRENEHLVELGNAKKIISPLLCAMVERTRGPASYLHFLEQLKVADPVASGKIAGYLGEGRR